MPWSWEYVILIASRSEIANKLLGTGTLIAPNRILTARHVVFDNEGKQRLDLVVRREGSTVFKPATVGWTGSVELDVAILLAEIDGVASGHPLALLLARDIYADESWEVQGYPAVRKEIPSERLEKVGGRTRSCCMKERTLFLDAPTHPGVWGGLSGAAVLIGNYVVSVVRSEPHGWDGQRLSTTPVAEFLHDPGFRAALGLGAEDARLARRVEQVVNGVASLLEKRPQVGAALSRKLVVATEPGAVAQTVAYKLVISLKASEVAKALNHVDDELSENGADVEDRRVVRSLLWQILPFAVDWRQLVVMGRSNLSDGKSFIELPLRSGTVAEIVLAGIDERCCRFAVPVAGTMPVGAALVRIPAAAQTALFDRDGSRLAQLIVQQLAAEVHIEASYSRYPDMRDAVEGTLNYHAYEAPQILPYYLLFVDADLGGKESEHDLWALARTVLGQELPSLRLVRLTGGSLKEETVLAKHIEAICSRTP